MKVEPVEDLRVSPAQDQTLEVWTYQKQPERSGGYQYLVMILLLPGAAGGSAPRM